MKIYELFEDAYLAHEASTSDPNEIANILKKQCSTFVSAYRTAHKPIFRGIRELKGKSVHFAQADIRPDRRPIFMPEKQHTLINDAMMELGLKAHRGNSIFCTTSRITAEDWGDIYTIFPVDGWTGTVFQKVKFGYVFDEIHDKSDSILLKHKVNVSFDYQKAVSEMAEVLSDLKPYSFSSQKDLVTVINESYDDILITGKKYYALSMQLNGDPTPESNEVFSILGI